METLCRIRDIYRAIAEFEVKFMQEFDLSLNEGMLLCTLLNTPQTHFQRDSGSARTVSLQCFQDNPFGRGEEADNPPGGKSG